MSILLYWVLPSLVCTLMLFMWIRISGNTIKQELDGLEKDGRAILLILLILWPFSILVFALVLVKTRFSKLNDFLFKERSFK